MVSRRRCSVIALIGVVALVAANEDGHDHSNGGKWEWTGLFSTDEDFYLWTAQKTRHDHSNHNDDEHDNVNAYADAHMKMTVLPASAGTDAALTALEAEGAHSMGMNCTEVEVGGVITPVEDVCYELHFDARMWQSLFLINTTGTSHAAIFTQHAPTEFVQTNSHYLTDDHGHGLLALHTRPEPPAPPAPLSYMYEWGGIFAVAEDFYMWTAQKSASNVYADAHMKLVVLPASAGTDAAFTALKAEGNHSMGMHCTEVEAGGVIKPMEDACYELHFDARMWQSLFLINTTGTSYAAIFTQHAPTEFLRVNETYLRDEHGCDVEPVHTHPASAAAVATVVATADSHEGHNHRRRLSEHEGHDHGSSTFTSSPSPSTSAVSTANAICTAGPPLAVDQRFHTLALAESAAVRSGCDPVNAHMMGATYMVGMSCTAVYVPEEEHAHANSVAWEWAGLFSVAEDFYTWTAQKGTYYLLLTTFYLPFTTDY